MKLTIFFTFCLVIIAVTLGMLGGILTESVFSNDQIQVTGVKNDPSHTAWAYLFCESPSGASLKKGYEFTRIPKETKDMPTQMKGLPIQKVNSLNNVLTGLRDICRVTLFDSKGILTGYVRGGIYTPAN